MTFDEARLKLLAELDVAWTALRQVAAEGYRGNPLTSREWGAIGDALRDIRDLNQAQRKAEG